MHYLYHKINKHQKYLTDILLKVIRLCYLNQAKEQIFLHLNNSSEDLFIQGLNSEGYQYFVIRIDPDVFGISRNDLHERLKEYNVITRKYFYSYILLQGCM